LETFVINVVNVHSPDMVSHCAKHKNQKDKSKVN